MGTASVIGAPAAAVVAAGALARFIGGPISGGKFEFKLPEFKPAVALDSKGPLGYLAAAGIAASSVVVVAGDEELKERCCWENVLKLDRVNSSPLSQSKIDLCRKNGMLLNDLAEHCQVLKTNAESDDDYDKLILKNGFGEHFAFSISLVVPAGTYEEEPNASHDVMVVHAVQVDSVKI